MSKKNRRNSERINPVTDTTLDTGGASVSSYDSSLKEELTRLQAAYGKNVEENHILRSRIDELQKELDKTEKLRQKEKEQIAQIKKINASQSQQLQRLTHQYERLRTRYDALSHSKLGRLTLYFWTKQANKPVENRGFHQFKFIEKYFAKLPSTENLQLELGLATQKPAPEVQVISSMSKAQENWFENYKTKILDIPESNGIRYYKKLCLKIGIICDEFFFDSIRSAADFICLTPENWKEEIDNGLDVLLFVSAWRGIHNEWAGLAALSSLTTNAKRQTAFELLDYCHSNSVKTIFYSKEDPPNYELFLDYAKRCDYIFTSAAECIPYYKKDCNNENVSAVTFGINPEIHNPIGSHQQTKEKTVLFSGSWMKKYPKRCAELAVIFDGVLNSTYDLHIVDRNYPANKNYQFPEEYFKFSSPALGHQELQKVHKLFDWAININSVKTSNTMFANRGFELQANGILLLSNFSVGVNSMLPDIMMVHDSGEVPLIVDNMNEEEIYELQTAGVRSVMTGHTCFDRMKQYLMPCGIDASQPERKILVIADKITQNVSDCFDRQTYQPKVLMCVTDVSEDTLDKYDMVSWFDENSVYGSYYLEDMANGFKYTACSYITKDAWYNGRKLNTGTEHNYVNSMNSKYRTLFWRDAFTADFLLGVNGKQNIENGYSIDHFSYNAVSVRNTKAKKKYLLSVVVPIYNNGKHLYGKCFNSLRRSSMFENMEIIFVDDGSTDERTIKTAREIESRFTNVSMYCFNDGGSGSASRPRNKGVEIASSDYITFLDPDNEAVCDGYAKLFDIAVHDDFDIVLGNMYKCDTENKTADNYRKILDGTGTDTFTDGFGDNLVKVNFLSISIQAMVIRKKIITENNLEQVVGSAGQDTLFSWQLLSSSKRIKAIDLPIHVYYAQTAGSVTNVIKPKFFEKLMLLQQPKLCWLRDSGLLDSFMDKRYDYYTSNWILKKLAGAENAAKCAEIVEQILDVYSEYYHYTDSLINNFLELCRKKDYEAAAACVKEAFPYKEKRPMPTLGEILENSRKPSVMKVEYEQNENSFTFRNKTADDDKNMYTWVVLLAQGAYQKIHSAKYSKDISFIYDFSGAQANLYKIRAFIKHPDGSKESEDVAYIKINEDGTAQIMKSESSAVPAEKG
ncbi:MAG: glycosyltransferase [Oscillospiraceae bacterium]|nr:glycosyltransferase [Oscillospiraceae bacterium]